MIIKLKEYGLMISDQELGNTIYSKIKEVISSNIKCVVDFENLRSMATFNAKQIFGKLYIELGADKFFEKIEILNASNDLKLIIRLGIQSALDDKQKNSN